MKKNDFMCINNIFYQIYNVLDFQEMQIIVLSLLDNLIPNTCASFLMADHTDSPNLLRDPVCLPAPFSAMENDYLAMEERDHSRWMLFNSKAMIVRDTDLLPEDERVKTMRYQKCYLPYNLHYSVDLSIADNNKLLGTLSLYRTREMGDFTDDELFMLNIVGEHLNARFYREFIKGERGEESDDLFLYLINEYGLTGREAEILQLVFQEQSNEDIAAELCISSNTLKKHLQC